MPEESNVTMSEDSLKNEEKALLEKLRENLRLQATARVKETMKMLCPKCGEHLEQSVVHDVPIETCPHCSGVWLDAGELELIAQRENTRESWLAKVWKFLTERRPKKQAADATQAVESSPGPGPA
ncbi:MAG TPA: zf-TFIIB domain-containing protein [Candidatus Obscuribacterales bacterium]